MRGLLTQPPLSGRPVVGAALPLPLLSTLALLLVLLAGGSSSAWGQPLRAADGTAAPTDGAATDDERGSQQPQTHPQPQSQVDYVGHTFGRPLSLLGLAGGLLLVVAAFAARGTLLQRLRRYAAASPRPWNEAAVVAGARTLTVALAGGGLVLIAYVLTDGLVVTLPELLHVRNRLGDFLLYLALLYVAFEWIGPVGAFLESLAAKTETELDDQLTRVAVYVLRAVVVVIGAFLLFDLVGAPVTALVAGLAIVAGLLLVAGFDLVRDVSSSFQLLADPAFRVGEVIRVGAIVGAVQRIGLRATELETPQRTRVLVPNHELARHAIENLSQRSCRRVDFHLDIARSTPPATVSQVLDTIRDTLLDEKTVGRARPRLDPETDEPLADSATGEPLMEGVDPLVVLAGIEEYGLRVQIRYDLQVVEFVASAQIQQTLLLSILDVLETHGVELVGPGSSAAVVAVAAAAPPAPAAASTKRASKKKTGSASSKRKTSGSKAASSSKRKGRTKAAASSDDDGDDDGGEDGEDDGGSGRGSGSVSTSGEDSTGDARSSEANGNSR